MKMTRGLCKYKHIFGKEGEGAHSIRLFNVAIVDVVFTLLAAFGISYYFHINIYVSIVGLFVLAIVAHRIFCVNTTVNKLIFGKV